MRGNFARTNRRPTLKQRLAQRRDYLRRLGQQDRANRCTTCRAPLTGQVFTLFGDPGKYCSALCVPRTT